MNELPLVLPLQHQGLNGDVNYQHRFGSNLSLNLNQGFFYTRLQHPLVLTEPSALNPSDPLRFQLPLSWYNASAPTVSQGLESYARLRYAGTELYLGYLYTQARRRYIAFR